MQFFFNFHSCSSRSVLVYMDMTVLMLRQRYLFATPYHIMDSAISCRVTYDFYVGDCPT
jgi:hypothetical protein